MNMEQQHEPGSMERFVGGVLEDWEQKLKFIEYEMKEEKPVRIMKDGYAQEFKIVHLEKGDPNSATITLESLDNPGTHTQMLVKEFMDESRLREKKVRDQ